MHGAEYGMHKLSTLGEMYFNNVLNKYVSKKGIKLQQEMPDLAVGSMFGNNK